MEKSCLTVILFLVVVLTTIITGSTGNAIQPEGKTKNNSLGNEEDYLYDKIRLPGNILPLKYAIYLHPNITDGKFYYTGRVKILLGVKEETDSIILHSLRLTHLQTQVFEVPENTNKITEVDYEKEIIVKRTIKHEKHEQAIIQLGSKLTIHKRYVLDIAFVAKLRSGLRGFYKSSYKTEKGEERIIATTHFEPTGARLAFPCFDEPAMKAKFKIEIVREGIHATLSNMPIEKTERRPDALYVDHFQESVTMSTYLVAFIVHDFTSLSAEGPRGIKVKVWTPRSQIAQARYAIEITPKILEYYEKFFNIYFPLPKLDLIGVPDFGAGAMENWGLITYRLTNLLYDEKESNSAAKQHVAIVIAHELAHQWFGNLVTMKWWNDLWLNEGFASFVEFVGADFVEPSWKLMDQFVTLNVQAALSRDANAQSHPISVPVINPEDIGALFDTVTYLKGSSLVFMMRDFIGNEHFANGLSDYLKEYRYENADSNDLWASLSKAMGHSKVSVKNVMDTWTLNMGYPVINIRRDGNTAHLTQERFLADAESGETFSNSSSRWNIPLTFYYEHDKAKKRMWFNNNTNDVHLKYDKSLGWLKLNVDEVGFYRVNYDEMNWKALIKQLNKEHTVLSLADRANLIDDAFQLAIAGKLTQTLALETTEYLKKETEYVPFKAAATSLDYIGEILNSRSGYASYEKYILQQALPLVRKLGWDDKGSHLNKLLRGVVLKIAVRHNDKESVKKAKEIFNELMVNQKSIPVNLREAVYYAVAKYGTEKEWNYMFNQYNTSKYAAEKQLLMFSLAHTSDPKILKKYLEMTLNDDIIKSQDSCYVINKIANNPIGRTMSYEYINKNWNIFIKRYGTGIHFRDLEQLFRGIFGTGKTKGDLDQAKKFFATHKLGGGELAAKQATGNILKQIKWLINNEKDVVDWLKNKTN